jgi:GDP-L-fucose synthase
MKTNFFAAKKILLTGGAGFLGTWVQKKLFSRGVRENQLIIPRKKQHDLREMKSCLLLTRGVNLVIHLAANVGGIGHNQKNPGSIFYDNISMGVNLIEASRRNNVQKFVQIGTVCAYPKYSHVPFQEDHLWDGFPEETNAAYGIAKKSLLVMLQTYRTEYGFNGIYLLPVNMYGPGDTFDPNRSHVIAALIKKIYDAKKSNKSYITLWGDGSPTREFFYVKDAAEAVVLATEKYNKPEPINIGAGFEISIAELAHIIIKLINYKGEIQWDISKPNGQPRRSLDVSKARKEFGFIAKTPFKKGLKNTIDWYIYHS